MFQLTLRAYIGSGNFQPSVCLLGPLGPTEKDEFVCLYYETITITVLIELLL